jgi:hypothetical protein
MGIFGGALDALVAAINGSPEGQEIAAAISKAKAQIAAGQDVNVTLSPRAQAKAVKALRRSGEFAKGRRDVHTDSLRGVDRSMRGR